MEIYQIVKKYLKENGYTGLVNSDNECGCEIDDLMYCDSPSADCEAGYKRDATEEEKEEYGAGCDWVISHEKP